jgi:perosamine synthetase
MVALGFNYRLTDIACALGVSQLRKLDSYLAQRRAIAARYSEAFSKMPGVVPPAVRPEVNPAWHLYPIRLDLSRLRAGRAEVINALRQEGLGVTVHYIPVHLHPYYWERFGCRRGDYPVAEEAYERLITLPLFPAMIDENVEHVIASVEKVISCFRS